MPVWVTLVPRVYTFGLGYLHPGLYMYNTYWVILSHTADSPSATLPRMTTGESDAGGQCGTG